MIQIKKAPGQKVLELGAGSSRNPATDVCTDVRPAPHVDFILDLEKPFTQEQNQGVSSDEFDCVLGVFCLEHVTWRKIPQLLSEVHRVLKTGGRAVFVTSNAEKQLEWAKKNPDGWDGKDFFSSVSCILFGDCDYPENSHKSFFTPSILSDLFSRAGFVDTLVSPAGARLTDLVVEGVKPARSVDKEVPDVDVSKPTKEVTEPFALAHVPRTELFDKHYFNGGRKYGGYAREGYWDYPHNKVKFDHVMKRNPMSVLELGSARGYLTKRFQDLEMRAEGLEISRHCYLTRACEGIHTFDLCSGHKWPFPDQTFDLSLSIAVMEHLPEQYLPHVLSEMARVSKRGLHGIDFGKEDTGFDRTHCSLWPQKTWQDLFNRYVPNFSVEVIDKEELEKGSISVDYVQGDGKLKVNVGSCTVMHYHGWDNLDLLDLSEFARANHYKFKKHDLKDGMPYGTGVVDMISASHVLEHFNYDEGLALLKEFRRVIRRDGLIRITVPDSSLLARTYTRDRDNHDCKTYKYDLAHFSEINDGVEKARTDAQRLYALLNEGHKASYDEETLRILSEEAGFTYHPCCFRMTMENRLLNHAKQMRTEGTDMFPDVSLFCLLTPRID